MGDVSALQVFKLSVSNASALADWEGFEPCKKEWFGVNCGESTRSKHRWAVVSIELPNCNLGGEIPEAIGDLVELTKLNLRNNNFTGLLPASLSRLTALESLDVSGNPFEVAPSTNLTAGAPPPLTSDPISIIPEPDAPGPKIPGLVKTGRKKGSGRKGRGKKGRGKAGKRGNSTAEPPAAEPPTTKPLPAAKPPTVKPLPATKPPAVKPPAVKPPAVKPPAVKPPVGTIPPKSSPDKVRLPAVPLEPPTADFPDNNPVPSTTRSPSLPPKSVPAPSDETASPPHSAAGETKTPAIEVPADNAGSTSRDSSDSSSGSSNSSDSSSGSSNSSDSSSGSSSSDNSTASLDDSSLASTSSSSPPPAPAESPSTNSIALYVGIAAGVVVAFLLGVALVLLYIYLRRRRAETKDFAPIKDVAAGADGRGEDYGTSGAVAAAGYAAGKAGKRGGGGVFGRLWPGTGKVADLGTVSAYQQQAHAPAAPSAAVPAHDHGANLLPPHDPSAMIPHSGASNHSGWGAAVSAVHSGVNSAAHSGVQSVTVEGGAASPYAPASAYASAAEPGSNMSSQFPSRTPSQTPSQPMSHVAGPGLAAAIAAEAGGGIGGGEGGSGGAGGGYAAHSSNSSAQTPGASVGSLKSGRNMAEYRLMLPGRSLSNTVMELTYEDVLGATDNLAEANVIGSGGFGRVYCGRLAGAGVAVKVLEAGSSQGDREFQAEVELLSRLRSPHLVHLVGYCMAGGNRVLVYNLMANGSLSDLLHDNSSDGSFVQRFGRERPQVEWQQRMQIALDAARGLMFLHHAASPAVIHRDFKSSNVLVDHDFHARIADFGLARDGPSGEKRWVSTRVLGTTGYLSPEYVTTGRLTPKSDVYSFGIVLLELLTGLTPIDHDRPPNRVSLTSWALPLLTQRERLGELLDPRLDGTVPLHEFMQVGGMWAAGGWGLDACGGCIGAKKRRDMQSMVHIGVQGMVHIGVQGMVHIGVQGMVHIGVQGMVHIGVQGMVHIGVQGMVHIGVQGMVHIGVQGMVHIGVQGMVHIGVQGMVHIGVQGMVHIGVQGMVHIGVQGMVHIGVQGMVHIGVQGMVHIGVQGMVQIGVQGMVHIGVQGMVHIGVQGMVHIGVQGMVHIGVQGMVHIGVQGMVHIGVQGMVHVGVQGMVHVGVQGMVHIGVQGMVHVGVQGMVHIGVQGMVHIGVQGMVHVGVQGMVHIGVQGMVHIGLHLPPFTSWYRLFLSTRPALLIPPHSPGGVTGSGVRVRAGRPRLQAHMDHVVQSLMPHMDHVVQSLMPHMDHVVQSLMPHMDHVVQSLMPHMDHVVQSLMPHMDHVVQSLMPHMDHVVQSLMPHMNHVVQSLMPHPYSSLPAAPFHSRRSRHMDHVVQSLMCLEAHGPRGAVPHASTFALPCPLPIPSLGCIDSSSVCPGMPRLAHGRMRLDPDYYPLPLPRHHPAHQAASAAAVCVQADPNYRPLMDDLVQSLMPLCKAAIPPPHPPPFLACPHPLSASLHQAASVAAVCLQADPDYRPHMDDVVQSLMPLCKAAISPYASPAQSNHSSLR
ncbi:unnamed protein product [Closterium sp. NIES-65]|nr:unnamed protein product [Closterium sp. NIES-65]